MISKNTKLLGLIVVIQLVLLTSQIYYNNNWLYLINLPLGLYGLFFIKLDKKMKGGIN